MKLKKVSIIAIILFIFILSYFPHIAIPNEIIVYNNGLKTNIKKSDKNFNKIFILTNQRIPLKLYKSKEIISDNSIDLYRKNNNIIAIEFIYTNKHTFISMNSFKYDRLFFVLEKNPSREEYKLMFYGNNGYYQGSPRGELKYSKRLIEIINSIL